MKQEIIFLWLNNCGCWQKAGVNFSPNYSVVFNHETNVLTIQNSDNINIFSKDNIMNLSAVIGENGTGKTTLLEFCNSLNDTPFSEFRDKEYTDYQDEINDQNSFISVYLIDNELGIINKTKESINYQGTKILPNNIYYRKKNLSARSNSILRQTTHIYFTNSEYAQDTNLFEKGIDHISIHNKALESVSRNFYKNIVLYGKTNESSFEKFQLFIVSNKAVKDFQQIIDVIFLYRINKLDKGNSYLGKNIKNVNFTFVSIIDLVYKYIINSKNNKEEIKEFESNFLYFQGMINKYSSKNSDYKYSIDNIIIINLAFELHYLYGFNCEGYELDVLFSNCINYIENNLNGIERAYYDNAIEEIKQVIELMKRCTIIESRLPKKDLGYQKRYTVSVTDLGRLLSNILTKEHISYIAKYIAIDGLEVSSGERALLNFSSRIELLDYLSNIAGDRYEPHDNILFLFDEIDLYVHPNAQRKLIDSLLKQIKSLFKGYNVQVVISSHSPIVLSDIPREHVSYLQKDNNGEVIVLNGRVSPQTFAANIPSLYRNSFFIDGGIGIGEYALNTINSIARKLYNREGVGDEELNNCKKIISIIGEPVLKKKLEEMLYVYCGNQGAGRCGYRENDNSERKKYLSFLKQQRSLIDSEIKWIEGESYD